MAGVTRTRTLYLDASGNERFGATPICGSYTNVSIPGTNKSWCASEYIRRTTTDVVNNRYYYWRKAGWYYPGLHDERPGQPTGPPDAVERFFYSEDRSSLKISGLPLEKKWSPKKLCFYYKPNNFDSVTDTNHVGILDGTRSDGIRKFVNYPCDYDPGPPAVDTIFPLPTTAEINAAANKALEKSNPQVPAVNIPTFLVELKDMPDLVRQWGLHHLAHKGQIMRELKRFLNPRNLKTDGPIRKVGSFVIGPKDVLDARALVKNVGRLAAQAHLLKEWVIKPTLGELRTLVRFFDEVSKRLKIIQDLRRYKRYSQRVFISASAYDSTPSTVILQSNGALVYADKVVHYSKKEWCSVDWVVQDMDTFPDNPKAMLRLAKRVATGVNTWSALSTAWELFPWSWAVDWMFGVQRFLDAANNSMGLKYQNICYMRTTSAHARYIRRTDLATSDQWARLSVTPFQRRERKLRRVGIAISNPFPVRLQPFLNGRAWSILGSLKILEEIKDDNTFLKFKPRKGFPVMG